MLKFLKNATLQAASSLGILGLSANSTWRQQRLLILCYHGISLKDEHNWRPLYVTAPFFRRRMQHLARRNYRILPLGAAVGMLEQGTLPPRSVAITFDDGFSDFHQLAFPVLREFGLPATVYQTTYYSDYPYPVFNLALSYLFWRGAGQRLDGTAYGMPGTIPLTGLEQQNKAVSCFLDFARQQGYTPAQKNELAARLAAELNVDYAEVMRLRMLQLMTPLQVAEIAEAGIDVQLHTHRHRTPVDEALFVREIQDNRQWLESRISVRPTHFCYPSGVWNTEFLPWLKAEGVVSATTCEYGIAARDCNPLLLPRLLDSMNITEDDFEAWLSGFAVLLPHRRT